MLTLYSSIYSICCTSVSSIPCCIFLTSLDKALFFTYYLLIIQQYQQQGSTHSVPSHWNNHLCTSTLVPWWETSQLSNCRYLHVNRLSAQLSTDWISPMPLHKAPHLHKDDTTCSAQPLPGKWLSLHIACSPTATYPCPKTRDSHPSKLC